MLTLLADSGGPRQQEPALNAGVGSALTIQGTVECDASIMDGASGLFGAVSGLTVSTSPISVAERLLADQRCGYFSAGRVPPMMLAGSGADAYATRHQIHLGTLKSEQAASTYVKHMARLRKAEEADDWGHDTVGAVCIDRHGDIASGVSSGGISLKQPGRVGEAALYGAGCYAQSATSAGTAAVGVSATGTGEQIAKTLLSRIMHDHVCGADIDMPQVINGVMKSQFLESPLLRHYQDKNAGLLIVKHQPQDYPEVWITHTTASMAVGRFGGRMKSPKFVMGDMNTAHHRPGYDVVTRGAMVR
ncbi:hypothetical protein RI367_004718 [Sorochytrium milnesiophthora]